MAAKSAKPKGGKAQPTVSDKESLLVCDNQNNGLQILFPDDFEELLERIRGEYDRSYMHWRPHINIVWPFISGKLCSSAQQESLARVLGSTPPFSLRFDGSSLQVRASPSKKPTAASRAYIVLVPTVEPADAISSLKTRVQREMGLHQVRQSDPHLTIAQLPVGDASAFIAAWRQLLFPASAPSSVIPVEHLHWVSRSPGILRGQSIRQFWLGIRS
ncbi:MAG: 2'-5' RNA ligase family protein [archaeon]|nr:2'-5' RNA ligase family protein [archaeon]